MSMLSNKQFIKQTKILGDATRLAILQILARKGSLCACKILEELHISQGTLSHHMKILTSSKLVSCRKDGKWRHYCLLPATLCQMSLFIRDICTSPKACETSACSCDQNSKK